EADHGADGRVDARRIGDRRPRRGDWRQLCAVTARRNDSSVRRHGHRAVECAEHGAVPRQPDVRPQYSRAAQASGEGWRVEARPDRRDHGSDDDDARRQGDALMQILELYVFVLAAFVGYMVISRVPPLLHTPLMAATNAISGI